MIDIPALKAERRSNGVKVTLTELLALAPKNDPFGVFTEARITAAEWAAKAWHDMGELHDLHIRRLHYWAVSSDVQKPDGLLSHIGFDVDVDVDVDAEPPRSGLVVDDGGWLFDSKRDYLDQLGWYRGGRA